MSITIDVIPAEIQSVNRPLIWEVSTDRFPNSAAAVTLVDSEPGGPFIGNARFAIGAHAFLVGDIFLGTGFAVEPLYNRIHVVVSVTATTITTDIVFLFDDTGTMTRRNNNFRIRADIGVFDSVNVPPVAIASAAINGVNTKFTMSTPHLLSEGDLLELTGTTTYDGLYIVRAGFIASDTEVTLETTFVATTTGDMQHAPTLGSIRQQVTVEAAANLWRFNIAGMLEAVISGDLLDLGGSGVTTPTPNSIARYFIFFEEEYDLKPAIAEPNERIFSTVNFGLNTADQHREVQTVDRFLLDGVTKKFLTNSPARMPKEFSEEFQLSFITDEDEIQVQFERFDNNGASIGLSTIPVTTVIDKRCIVAVNSAIFTLAHSRIDIWINETGGGTRISEKKRFDRDDNCYRKPIRFQWLSRPGGHDAHTFTGDYLETLKGRKTTYQRDLGATVEKRERGTTVLSSADRPSFRVFSEFLNDEHKAWLTELLSSPDVFLQEGDDLIPIEIINRSTKLDDTKRLTQFRIDWREANEPNTQGN